MNDPRRYNLVPKGFPRSRVNEYLKGFPKYTRFGQLSATNMGVFKTATNRLQSKTPAPKRLSPMKNRTLPRYKGAPKKYTQNQVNNILVRVGRNSWGQVTPLNLIQYNKLMRILHAPTSGRKRLSPVKA